MRHDDVYVNGGNGVGGGGIFNWKVQLNCYQNPMSDMKLNQCLSEFSQFVTAVGSILSYCFLRPYPQGRPSRTRAMPYERTWDHLPRFDRLGIIVLGGIQCYEYVFNRMSRSSGEHSCSVTSRSQVRFSPKRSANQTYISSISSRTCQDGIRNRPQPLPSQFITLISSTRALINQDANNTISIYELTHNPQVDLMMRTLVWVSRGQRNVGIPIVATNVK
jgi:hypothetical protein